MGVARIRPATETSGDVPAGLEGVVVAETTIGDVRGQEGFFHYRQYSAVDLAETRSLEDVWHLLFRGELPDAAASTAFAEEVRAAARHARRPEHAAACARLAGARRSTCCAPRSRCSGPSSAGARRTTSGRTSSPTRPSGCAPWCRRSWRRHTVCARGDEPVEPRDDLGFAANYLYMLTGEEPSPAHARAIEQYMILTIDHGFNASTFTARVVTSTGADLGAAIVAAIGALSGPLHGGAPSRALDMLDAIGTPGPGRGLHPPRRRERRAHHGLRPPRLQDR